MCFLENYYKKIKNICDSFISVDRIYDLTKPKAYCATYYKACVWSILTTSPHEICIYLHELESSYPAFLACVCVEK